LACDFFSIETITSAASTPPDRPTMAEDVQPAAEHQISASLEAEKELSRPELGWCRRTAPPADSIATELPVWVIRN
jgi:hypothetical protein